MWTLGFDTTSATVTAALMCNGDLMAHYSASSATSHSTTLLPAIEDILTSAGITVRDLDLIACSAGPGSFTGVRIGTATAKGLAAPFGIPCVGVSSLEAMASVFTDIPGIICPALNARRGNAYTAFFMSDGNGSISRLSEDDLLPISELNKYVVDAVHKTSFDTPNVYVVGDSINEIRSVLEGCHGFTLRRSPALLASPSGYGVALAGRKIYLDSGMDKELYSNSKLVPIYLRKSQAEREKEEKKAASGIK